MTRNINADKPSKLRGP